MELLSKEHSILERPFMLFRPFGVTPDGQKIRDVSGITIKAKRRILGRSRRQEKRGSRRSSNHRAPLRFPEMPASAIPRTTSPLNFYRISGTAIPYEFTCYLGEFCILISGDPNFQFEMGKHKFISPVMQTLGTPVYRCANLQNVSALRRKVCQRLPTVQCS